MTPKEKAKELFDKFNKIKHSVSTHVQKERSKQCALSMANELYELAAELNSESKVMFFDKVKQEINNL